MIKSTSTLKGEKLKEKEIKATKRVRKWSFEKESQGKRPKFRFSFRAARKMSGNVRKNERLRGVSGGKEEMAHYAR